MGYYDDNFGHWDMSEGEEMMDFYRQVQRESVEKICKQCEQPVRLRHNYVICNDCADQNERGY
jgi:Zn finger protein HypA/HybF involved in hydrogenase expression